MTIIYDGRIATVGLSSSYYNQDEYAAGNITLSTDPATGGGQVAKCTLLGTDGQVRGLHPSGDPIEPDALPGVLGEDWPKRTKDVLISLARAK